MKVKLISIADLIWLAGLLEGEGNFGLFGTSNNKQPRITLNMCDLDVVEKAARILGGKARIIRKKKYIHHWSQSYQYVVVSHLAITWMRLIFPYMGIRRQAQIKVVLDFWDSIERRKPDFNTILPELEKAQNG